MKYIKSCGFVVYKIIDDKLFFLIIKSRNGDIGFPKGHMEKNETEIQTAIRELKEETNLEVDIIDGYRNQLEYEMKGIKDTIKQSLYFLGKAKNDNIICQYEEVEFAKFVLFEEALEALTFNETKELLIKAKNFIENKKQIA